LPTEVAKVAMMSSNAGAVANPVTYADLDALLAGTGFGRRTLSDRHVAYLDRTEEPIFVFPDLPIRPPSMAVPPALIDSLTPASDWNVTPATRRSRSARRSTVR
jgi:hypothetical protein